jgi:hypothetical protein
MRTNEEESELLTSGCREEGENRSSPRGADKGGEWCCPLIILRYYQSITDWI